MMRYPVFIPSKGRAFVGTTWKVLEALGVDFRVFIEPQDLEDYSAALSPSRLVVLPHSDKGLCVTRNYIWDYAARIGASRFWTFDDNIKGLYRYNRNLKVPCSTAAPLRAIEEWSRRFSNVGIAGCNYFMFIIRKDPPPPLTLNTRIYSNMLIWTDLRDEDGVPIRNRLFFNDDTDLCLQALSAGWCTALFNAFLVEKATTMTTTGGMTDYYEETDERREFVEELAREWPSRVKMTRKWGRWHHHVDYRGFKQYPERVTPRRGRANEFGMRFERKVDGAWAAATFPEAKG